MHDDLLKANAEKNALGHTINQLFQDNISLKTQGYLNTSEIEDLKAKVADLTNKLSDLADKSDADTVPV
jgi:predicted  nucleic acid-binding Zn-ribbon protein